MKAIIIITAILTLTLFNLKADAQHLEAQVYFQETIVGLQKGYSIKKVNKKGIKMGLFHQSTQTFSFREGERNYPFTGTEIAYPISKCGKLKLYANLKTGILNNQFLIAIPEIETVMTINQLMTAGLASSIRAGEASIALKLNISVF